MKNIFNKHVSFIIILFSIIAGLLSCSKMDDYKAYTAGGEISYTGKIDSLKIYPGHNRVLVKGLFISDPKVKSIRIYWNSRRDSLVIPVTRTTGVDTLKRIITGLAEGTQNFEFVTFDALLNPSIIIRASATVYGDRYVASIINRPIAAVELGSNESTTIDWGDVDKTTGVLASQITYTKTDGSTAKVTIPVKTTQTILPTYKYGSAFTYKTGYLPDTLSIDTFYTAVQEVNVKTNVTAQYILNPGNPFTSTDNGVNVTIGTTTTNWRKLAGWITEKVDNWSGYGSWVNRSMVGTMSMEAGKSTVTGFSYTNGKIYQTVKLPAGSYTFEAVVANVSSTGSFFMAASKITDKYAGPGLPDIENMGNAIASISFNNIATQTLNFVLHEEADVSIGFVGTVTGTTAANQYLKITSVRLKYIKD